MKNKRPFILTGTVLLALNLVSMWMLFLSTPPESARAASYTVCLAGPPTCDFSSIQDAVDAATNGDTILVAAGSYSENIIISETLTLEGEGVNNTIVNGSQAIEVFSIESSGTVTITGMTIKKGGKTNVENHGKLTIDKSIISDNVGGGCFPCSGGGIWNDGTLTVTNSIVDGNSAWFGGGILNMDIGVATLINSSISNNYGDGGGIFNRGMLILNDCVVNDNNGLEDIWSEGTITLTNTTLSSNTGTGITISSGNVSLNNVTLSGGGISAYSGLVSIRNSIIPSCSAEEGVIVSNGYNLVGVVDGCNWVEATGDLTGTLAEPLDPVIGPLQDNGGPTLTHALLLGSPAMDAGSCPDVSADQRGFARPVDKPNIPNADDGCDIGAYEAQYWLFLPLATRNYCPPLYYDDFSDPGSGWPVGYDGNIRYEYVNGEYRILLRNTNWWAGARPGFQASDYILAADAINIDEVNGSYGLIFGLSYDWNQFYTFEVDTDGYYMVWKYNNTDWSLLTEGWSPAINTGNATNQLKIKREGTLIEAYVNGQFLASLSDGSYTGMRYLGLIINSHDESNLDVRFDNFAAYPVTCNIDVAHIGETIQTPNLESLDTIEQGQIFSQPQSRE